MVEKKNELKMKFGYRQMVEDQSVIMKINIHKKDGSFDKQIKVQMENVHLSDFTIRKIRPKNTPEPKLILKKVGRLPATFWEEYKTNYFIINDDNYFTWIDKNTELVFENKYTILL